MLNNKPPFNVTVLTLYKDAFPGYLGHALAKKALDKKLWSLKVIDIRDFALDKNRTVDDKVFGGGAGLLLKPDVLGRAIEFAFANGASENLIYPTPRGKQLNQGIAVDLSKLQGITFVCGHFEGIDERVIDKYNPLQLSIGDYILSGGELSSMVIVDSILRLLPDVIHSQECVVEESFSDILLEYPQYTKPRVFEDMEVPEVLLSGNHDKIQQWRLERSKELTSKVRPDLWEKYNNKR